MIAKILIGMLVISVAFGAWQIKRVENLKVELTVAAGQITALQGNLADTLRDRMLDNEIDNLNDADLLEYARSHGWLQSDNSGN